MVSLTDATLLVNDLRRPRARPLNGSCRTRHLPAPGGAWAGFSALVKSLHIDPPPSLPLAHGAGQLPPPPPRSNVPAACCALPQGLWFSRLLNLFGDKEARILVGAGALAAGGIGGRVSSRMCVTLWYPELVRILCGSLVFAASPCIDCPFTFLPQVLGLDNAGKTTILCE